MLDFLERINETSILRILGKDYQVTAKAKYVTETETTNWYAKLQLSNHHVLVVAPFDNFMYFGYVGEPYPCNLPSPDAIIYDGKCYTKDAEDYQIVKEFVFGDFLSMEGEVQFADYSYEDSLVSIGLVVRTQERADVYAKVIELSDIEVVK